METWYAISDIITPIFLSFLGVSIVGRLLFWVGRTAWLLNKKALEMDATENKQAVADLVQRKDNRLASRGVDQDPPTTSSTSQSSVQNSQIPGATSSFSSALFLSPDDYSRPLPRNLDYAEQDWEAYLAAQRLSDHLAD